MRKSKIASLLAIIIAVMMFVVGCGADISSVLNITTTDGTFSGTRVITVLIDNDDLSYVTGGFSALETVVKENLPPELTYTVANPSDSQSSIIFTLAFTSLDDYRTKVTNLLNANEENDIVPEIGYEKQETIFKTGLKFTENFESFDLIRWYYNALQTADIISESSSNWYEIGTDELIIDGESLDAGAPFNVDNQEKRCFDECKVYTVMNSDGTFNRTITFMAYEETMEALDEASGDIAKYMGKLATDEIIFETVENEDGYTEFRYSISNVTAEDIVKATNTVMQNENNKFTVDIQPKADTVGKAVVTINECLDGSYYLDYEDQPLESLITTYPNFVLNEEEDTEYYYGYESENELYYYPYAGTTYSIAGDWTVGYEKVEMGLSASNEDKAKVELTFTICDSLADEIKDIAFSALEAAAQDNGEYKRDGSVATFTVSGDPEEIADKFNSFVAFYVTEEVDEGTEYCTAELEEMSTSSKLTDGITGYFYLDLSPVLGDMNINVSQKGNTKIVEGASVNGEGELCTNSYISVQLATTKLNIVCIALLALSVMMLGVGVAVCVVKRKELVSLITVKKKPTPVEEPTVDTQEEEISELEEDNILPKPDKEETETEVEEVEEEVEIPTEEEEEEIM